MLPLSPTTPVAQPKPCTPHASLPPPAAAADCSMPSPSPSPSANAELPLRPPLAEPMLRRMAVYELQRACAFARVPDFERMQNRLESACTDMRQLNDAASQVETAHQDVVRALYNRAVAAAQAGELQQTERLVQRMQHLAEACAQPPEAMQYVTLLTQTAVEQAFERSMKGAQQAAEFGDACALQLRLEDADRHAATLGRMPSDRALMLAVCSRRMTDPESSLLLRLLSRTFADSQVKALEAVAKAAGQEVPQEVYGVLAMLPLDSSDGSSESAAAEIQAEKPPEQQALGPAITRILRPKYPPL